MAKKEEETPVEPTELAESAPSTPTEQPTVDPVVPAPEADPAPAAPAPETTNVKKKGGALKIILIVVLAIIVIAGGVLGYGFYNGTRVKAYAKDAQKMMDGTKEWEKSIENLDFEKDLAEIKTKVAKVKTDSAKNLATLNAKSAPGKAKDLGKNLKEYFTLSEKLAGQAGDLIDWAAEVQNMTKSLESLSSIDSSSTATMTASMEKSKADMQTSLDKLKKMTPPDSVKDQHAALVSMMEDLIKLYDKMIAALKTGDLAALMTVESDASSIATKSKTFENADKDISNSFKSDSEKIDSLESTIYTEIGELKNINFSF